MFQSLILDTSFGCSREKGSFVALVSPLRQNLAQLSVVYCLRRTLLRSYQSLGYHFQFFVLGFLLQIRQQRVLVQFFDLPIVDGGAQDDFPLLVLGRVEEVRVCEPLLLFNAALESCQDGRVLPIKNAFLPHSLW